ncbi:MAG TPA: hypothetical protein DCR55_07350 [Lentisphaeria bacterium]|nr:hypothetical protein [Lentisphaeria bacterium]
MDRALLDAIAVTCDWGYRRDRAVASAALGVLKATHAAGIVHGDFEPANIMLEQGGRTVLADYGLAQLPGESRE